MKKKLTMIFVAGMALSFSIGCSVFGAETVTEQDRKYGEKIERMDKTKEQFDMAKVVEVNESTLVVTLAEKPEMPEGEKPEKPPRPEEDGERPELPPMPESEDGERPELPPMPEGEDGERPERPRHNNKMMEELNFVEETMEIILDENVEIHKNGGEQGTVEEIEADDVIRIFYAEDGETVQSIFVNKEKQE